MCVCVSQEFLELKSTPGSRFLGQFPQDIILHPDEFKTYFYIFVVLCITNLFYYKQPT